MSKRAEEAAYNYVKENGTLGYDYNQIYDAAKNGYEQAEKDLALTVKDIEAIDQIMLDLSNTYAVGNFDYELGTDEFYEEVLKRFKEYKEQILKI